MMTECPKTCRDTRRKIMFDANRREIEMCYEHIADAAKGQPVKPIYVRRNGILIDII
mgnify:FL=1